MFDDVLIESAGRDRRAGGWVGAVASILIHVAAVGAVVMAGYYVNETVEVSERPMNAFIVSNRPAPPPPPPPPASGSSSPPQRRRDTIREDPRPVFTQPQEMPREVPHVDENVAAHDVEAAGEGGIPGGVAGGQRGGIVGGELGGEPGGTIGGTLGGQPGGTIGGGGATEVPVRVGGNVVPPRIVSRIEPQYTEAARRSRIEGVVIIEAVIDRQGNVAEARLLKPLPMGLDEQALRAIRAWKFEPARLNGQPIAVYYNLTVNFHLR